MSDVRTALERLLGSAAVGSLEASGPGALPMARPESEEQLVDAVKLAASERWTIVPVGLGSKLSWRSPTDRRDFALSTRRITGIVAYEPGDGTLTARAGTTIEALSLAAQQGGNHFTPSVPRPGASTLGGVLAAGQSGFDRLRYGPSRHHVLGMRVALADGTVAKSGGRLVKNVTGYDMHRLYCGSRGTLCVILEASMRLFAGFERKAVVSAPARDRSDAIAMARAVEALGLRPLCVRAENVLDSKGAWRVHVALAGRPGHVDWARRAALEAMPGSSEDSEWFEPIRDLELSSGSWAPLRVAGRPSRLREALAGLDDDVPMVLDPSIASAEILSASAGIVRELTEAKLEVTLRGMPEGFRAGPGAAIMDRLRGALDPAGVFTGS